MEAVVEYEYTAEQEDELSLKVGDILTNVQTAEGGWWEGELNGKKGMFPENFVKLVKRREPASNKKEEKREATQRKSVRELASKLGGVPMGGPPKKKDKKKKCKVLFEYKKENDDELDLAVGDILDFHRQVEEGWWEGTLNGKHGVFPSNFVEMVEDLASPDESSPAVGEDKDKSAGDSHNKDSDFQTIKGKKVIGVGLGNIFGAGPIKLRAVGDGGIKEDVSKTTRPGDSTPDSAPEAAKREKQNTAERAIVRFSYTAEQPDELSLVEGQIVRILEKELEDEGWWKGEINGKIGVFPDNFVELCLNEEPSRPTKPLPPTAATKQALLPKLPDRTQAEAEDKARTEPQPPSVGKKPQAPPPIGKKPLNQKSISTESKVEPTLPSKPAGSVKEKPGARENHTENQNSEGSAHFDDIEPAGQKLTHLTYGRAKGPKKRPPSTVLILNEGEKDGDSTEEIKNSHTSAQDKHHTHLPEKPDKPHPILLPKDNKHLPHADKEPITQTVHHPPAPSSLRDRETHTQAPPARPPEPTTAPPSHASSAPSIQMNKLLEQLQREVNELKTNSVSKAQFNELRVEHEKLKSEFENLKNNHSSKIRDLMNEVDEEKKLRLITQVEIERVKKLISETHV